jgi:hypothetical protein
MIFRLRCGITSKACTANWSGESRSINAPWSIGMSAFGGKADIEIATYSTFGESGKRAPHMRCGLYGETFLLSSNAKHQLALWRNEISNGCCQARGDGLIC